MVFIQLCYFLYHQEMAWLVRGPIVLVHDFCPTEIEFISSASGLIPLVVPNGQQLQLQVLYRDVSGLFINVKHCIVGLLVDVILPQYELPLLVQRIFLGFLSEVWLALLLFFEVLRLDSEDNEVHHHQLQSCTSGKQYDHTDILQKNGLSTEVKQWNRTCTKFQNVPLCCNLYSLPFVQFKIQIQFIANWFTKKLMLFSTESQALNSCPSLYLSGYQFVLHLQITYVEGFRGISKQNLIFSTLQIEGQRTMEDDTTLRKLEFGIISLCFIIRMDQSTDYNYHFMYRTKYRPLITSQQIPPSTQKQVQNQHSQPKEIIPYLFRQNNNELHNSQDLFPYTQKDSRLSETFNSRRQSPTKIQHSLFQSSISSRKCSSFASEVDRPQQNLTIQAEINKEEEIFECRHYGKQSEQSCQFCKGRGYLKQNDNLVKFFRYITDFKLGKKPSYQAQKLKTNKTQENSICSDFYHQPEKIILKKCNNKNFTYRVNERKSQKPAVKDRPSNFNIKRVNESTKNQSARCSTKSVTYYRKEEVIEEFNSVLVVHESYQCDECVCQPIVGTRFHCNTCEDFDLCQKCFTDFPHVHQMQKIQKSGKNKQIENMLSFLASPLKLSSSLRPPQIKRQNYLAVTRSAIA